MPYRAIVAIALIGLLSGCQSVLEKNYYTLDMRASAAGDVGLSRLDIDVADALNRSQIMIRIAPTEVTHYATDEWAGDLSELVEEKLHAAFGYPAAPAYTVRVEGKLQAFEQVDRPDGSADARVKLTAAVQSSVDPTRVSTRVYEVVVPAAEPGASATVEALSAALEEIADRIRAEAVALHRSAE